MDNSVINVAVAFDNKYTSYAYITLSSLFQSNADSEVHVYILQYDLSEESKRYIDELAAKYKGLVQYLFVDKNRFSDRLPITDKWPIEVYFRLLLTELLPKDVHRIIYLDSDMIVNSSLSDLYNTDLEGCDMAACYDLTLLGVALDVFLYYRHPALTDLFNEKTYINSGSLLLDMDKLRENYPLDIYLEAAKELDYKIYAPDQDLINYVHRGKIKLLDSRKYNYPAYIAYLEEVHDKSLVPIMHFTGPKPWQGGNHAHFHTENFWWDYAFDSPFAEALSKTYILDSQTDTTIMEELTGTDKAKIDLVKENARLKSELEKAMASVKQVIAMFENK